MSRNSLQCEKVAFVIVNQARRIGPRSSSVGPEQRCQHVHSIWRVIGVTLLFTHNRCVSNTRDRQSLQSVKLSELDVVQIYTFIDPCVESFSTCRNKTRARLCEKSKALCTTSGYTR